jgi:hypothetical protein
MTTPNPAGNQPQTAGGSGTGLPIRSLTAWALLALAAVIIVFAFLRLIFAPFPQNFLDRFSVGSFINITVLVAPLLAVLLALKVGPALKGARLMSLVALGIYALALLFGGIAFLFTIVDKFNIGDRSAYYMFGALLQGFGDFLRELILLVLTALVALWTYQISSLGDKAAAASQSG